MINTFIGDTDCVFSEILWSSCFDCSIRTKLKFSFLSPLAFYCLKQAWKTHWPRKGQYRVMDRKTIRADLRVSYKGRITVKKHLEDLPDTPVYHSQIFDRKRFKFCRRKLLWGHECTTQSTNKQVFLSERTSESSKFISRTMEDYFSVRVEAIHFRSVSKVCSP